MYDNNSNVSIEILFRRFLVVRLLNDSGFKIGLKKSGLVDGQDKLNTLSINSDIVEPRSGSWMKGKYFSVRSQFPQVYLDWSVSGQKTLRSL